ncbi:hypothetical protein BISA_2262 [Bifidobacterium saguini DSM 23967]|uniref:Secreted protein n=3 Tax=Bifidobacterium saguini TaxID=762210 RepID=A0A087D5V1_9BIFI|nr:hypothetical protein BISA_2262 [Bifidobacterium saguini DSM 23967]QTB91514.1 hypothetical protein BSD967_03620 [Bifidobacterium saguini]
MRKTKALLCTLMTVTLFVAPASTAFADGPASGGVLQTGSSLGMFWVKYSHPLRRHSVTIQCGDTTIRSITAPPGVWAEAKVSTWWCSPHYSYQLD